MSHQDINKYVEFLEYHLQRSNDLAERMNMTVYYQNRSEEMFNDTLTGCTIALDRARRVVHEGKVIYTQVYCHVDALVYFKQIGSRDFKYLIDPYLNFEIIIAHVDELNALREL